MNATRTTTLKATHLDHTPEPEQTLLERFHSGAPEAIDTIAVRFFEDVVRFCRSILADDECAMDAVQETFLRILERHRLFDPSRPFRPWLFTVCRNTCLGLKRERAAQSARILTFDSDESEVERLAAELPPAFEIMIRREREREALRHLGTLPESTREIFVLHLFEGLTFREISDIVGRPAPTVATLYYRALAGLKRDIESDRAARSRNHAL